MPMHPFRGSRNPEPPEDNGCQQPIGPSTSAGPLQQPAAADGAPQSAVPATLQELLALQQGCTVDGARLQEVLALIRQLGLSPWECQQLALSQLAELRRYHAAVLAEMQDEQRGSPAQVACWAIDGDRLMHCLRLLESITLA